MGTSGGLLGRLPPRVSIYEVAPRDGLQNEKVVLSIESKKQLVSALLATGVTRIELTSFVAPRWIPQLSDADELAAQITPPAGVTFSALCPNAKGLERARAAGLREIAVFLSASETHNRKNTNKTIEQSLSTFAEVVPPALEAGMRVRAYVSTVWGCPYEGEVEKERALAIAEELLALGCYQISLGDTIGAGTPRQTESILDLFLEKIPASKIALHLHDTRGTALANVLVGLAMGIADFDAAIGGLGGCPYAPGAAGNVATEDLVYMLHGMGIETGLDLEKLIEAAREAERIVGRPLPGKVHQAGITTRR
jgi:hydroxymethylglutaryl-CoA lyase